MRLRLLLLFCPCLAFSQIYSVAQKTTTLSAAAEVITIQQPATPTKLVRLVSVYADCSVTCTITLERNGGTATTLALTPKNLNPSETAPVTTAFSGSDSSAGTVIQVATLSGGGSIIFDLSRIQFLATQTSANLNVRTSSITGTVHITILFSEQ